MNKLEEDCRGCRDFNENNSFCMSRVKPSFTIWCKEIKCPCRTCLVKGMCREECNDVEDYFQLFLPKRKAR